MPRRPRRHRRAGPGADRRGTPVGTGCRTDSRTDSRSGRRSGSRGGVRAVHDGARPRGTSDRAACHGRRAVGHPGHSGARGVRRYRRRRSRRAVGRPEGAVLTRAVITRRRRARAARPPLGVRSLPEARPPSRARSPSGDRSTLLGSARRPRHPHPHPAPARVKSAVPLTREPLLRHAGAMSGERCPGCGGTGLTEHERHTVEPHPETGELRPLVHRWTGSCTVCSGTGERH